MASLIDRIAQKQATLLVPAGQYLDGSRFSKMFHAPAADCLPEGSVGGRQQYICQTPQFASKKIFVWKVKESFRRHRKRNIR